MDDLLTERETPTNPLLGELLPEPERRHRRYTIVSADDHVVEPPHLFEGRMPHKFGERTPRVVSAADGSEGWLFEGTLLPNVGFNATAGRKPHRLAHEPICFRDMRRSAWDIKARIADMDLDGVYASLCFPSFLGGFGGVRLQTLSPDREFSLALVRAWNSWMLEEWCGTYPDRMIACQLPWLHDPDVAAEEIRRNAARGFRAVTFPEAPHEAGLPSLHCGYWDPFIAACAETNTVICVHTGSAGKLPQSAVDAPFDATSALFGAGYSLTTAVDWLYSRYAIRFPSLKIVVAEGGIGWVPALLDRLDHMYRVNGDKWDVWVDTDLHPSEILKRNFWFCLLDEPSAMAQRYRIGVENILFETDFPHTDTSWPNSQDLLHRHVVDLPREEASRISWRNAVEVFGLPTPPSIF